METCFGGKEFTYEDRNGDKQTVRISDNDLYRALRQLQTFEDYDTGTRPTTVAVVYSRSEWIDALTRLGCEPTEYWNSNHFSANGLYSKVQEEKDDLDAVLSILNGSKSETRKNDTITEACRHFGVTYLGKAREELVESSKKAADMNGIVEFLEETRRNQIRTT